MITIDIKNLEKSFKNQRVLKGVDLSIAPGTINGIMGPNGSGKSTLIRCLVGLVIPDSGSIEINGDNVLGGWEHRKLIGYMPQMASYPDNVSVSELIHMISDIRKEKGNAEPLIKEFGLENALHKKMKELSGGMKQKVNLILSLMFNSSLLIFDEPTVGLDPVARLKFRNCIEAERMKGKTILVTSHYTSEIEELADNVIFLLDGKIFFQGPVEQMKEEQNESNLERAAARILENATSQS